MCCIFVYVLFLSLFFKVAFTGGTKLFKFQIFKASLLRDYLVGIGFNFPEIAHYAMHFEYSVL